MAAFTDRPWGRYVQVRSYSRIGINGVVKLIPSHLRSWPGTKRATYFWY
jgi:hypothetical protein